MMKKAATTNDYFQVFLFFYIVILSAEQGLINREGSGGPEMWFAHSALFIILFSKKENLGKVSQKFPISKR